MRVISGKAKGRILRGPKNESIRPALDKVKGAIFNILFDVTGLKILDLYAGTGSIGIEALSRGAVHATFVDSSLEALKLIRKNLKRCGFENQATLIRIKLPHELPKLFKRMEGQPFDLIFVDPPYDRNLVNPTLEILAQEKFLAPDGTIIVEHSPRERIKTETRAPIIDERKYGQTFISFCCMPRIL